MPGGTSVRDPADAVLNVLRYFINGGYGWHGAVAMFYAPQQGALTEFGALAADFRTCCVGGVVAKRTVVEFVDDIDGSPAQQTTMFSLDGVVYEIDLNARHAQDLRSLLERYIAHARREPARGGNRSAERDQRRSREANKGLTAQIRETAQRTREHLSDKPAKEQTDHLDAEPSSLIAVVGPEGRTESRKSVCAPELAPPQFSSL
ncbi:histone-like nucleoid-structuring protein Lsr2 [Saccharopolyspora sp. NPDC003762]